MEKALAEKFSRIILSSLELGATEIDTAKAKHRAISRLKIKKRRERHLNPRHRPRKQS
jgi:hypothetical protein